MDLVLNGKTVTVSASPETPLLWVIRDILGLTGTKFGCGMSLCGACTVHLDGEAIRSCVTPIAAVSGRKITTIEGLAQGYFESTTPPSIPAVSGAEGGKAGKGTEQTQTEKRHPLQVAWLEEDVAQCGYCQPGQIMQAASLLSKTPNPSLDEVKQAMAGNLCRCGTYSKIQSAVLRGAGEMQKRRQE